MIPHNSMLARNQTLSVDCNSVLRYGEEAGRPRFIVLAWREESPDSTGKGAG